MSDAVALVRRVQEAQGNSIAADKIIRDYLPFIKAEVSKTVHRMVAEGIDDEVAIAMVAFHEAIESYSNTKGAFLRYAGLLIKRRLIDYYRREKRHNIVGSLDIPIDDSSEITAVDIVAEKNNAYTEQEMRDATREEIEELSRQLAGFGVTLTDIADNCPKQFRTLAACREALQYVRENPVLLEEIKRTGRLPIALLAQGAAVERKTLERHRKYILALLVIYSNGYEIIRGHLKQVLNIEKGVGYK